MENNSSYADLAKYLYCCMFVEAPALKFFKIVERKSQCEMLRVVFNDANITTSVFSGTVSKLHVMVSGTSCTLTITFSTAC